MKRGCFLSSPNKSAAAKVRFFLDRCCAILSSFKIVVIFNNTSADFVWYIKNDHNFERTEDRATVF